MRVWWEGFVKGDARVKAVREMPRPCVRDVEQALGIPQVAKSSLTSDHQWWSILC